MKKFDNTPVSDHRAVSEKAAWTRPELKSLTAQASEAGILPGPEILILLS